MENQGSFNAIIVYMTWYRLVFGHFDTVAGKASSTERDCLESQLNQRAAQLLELWASGTRWAYIRGDGEFLNFQNAATELSKFNETLKNTQAADLVSAVDSGSKQIISTILQL